MRVVCQTIDEFIDNLQDREVVFGTIWLSKVEDPLNGKTKRDATSFQIGIQASAVVQMGDGGQYLLEAGEFTGKDYKDASPTQEGTTGFEELKRKIEDVCHQRSWQIKPGLVDV